MASCLVTNICGNSARCSSEPLTQVWNVSYILVTNTEEGGLARSYSGIQSPVTTLEQSFNANINAEW